MTESNAVEVEEEDVPVEEDEIELPTEGALKTVDNIVSPLRYTPDPCSTCH